MSGSKMLVRAWCLLAVLVSAIQAQEMRQRRVTIPPLIYVEPPKKLAFREEESIELKCVATGEPEPEYYWNFNGALFSPSGNDGRIARQPGKGTLIFARPIRRDEGIYQCFAENKHGISASVKVDLRLGILKNFNTALPRTHYPQIGTSLTLPCTPPQSYPPAQVFWATVAQREGLTPIDLTDRVSIDPIGNLHFANILEYDRQNGRQYVCIVQNKVMRRTQQGAYQRIEPRGGTVRRMPPQILWQSPVTQAALLGDILKIKCIFSGSPTPRVTWSRENGAMPNRKREESFGQELVIERLEFEDSGKYECQGINEEASVPIRRSFDLSIEAAPYWIRRPEIVNAAEGTTNVFHCEASGLPEPTIFWFINGRSIATVEADSRRVVAKNSITIENVTNDDAFVIQCNATNKHGYIWANAYLNVQTEPPFILAPPEDGKRVAEGQTVNLRCKVFGSPKPLIVWTKQGEQLTGGRFRVLEDGDLEIADVSLVDAGEYTCTASNRLDTVSDTGTLIVRRKTTIQTPPLDVMVYEGTEAKFTCTATTDPEEIGNLQIGWKKDGQIIDYRIAQRVFRNDMDNSVTISGTISLDTGEYTCVASNGLDESEASAQLVVQGRPDAPNNVRVKCYENYGTAEVEWQPGKENYAPILNFIVQFNTTFAPDTWIQVPNQVNQTDRRLDVKLSPWGNYTFRVLARNKIGTSPPSDHTEKVCETLQNVPDKNPENVIGEGDEPDNLVIYWTPMPKIEQNGPNFKYIVSWKKLNDPDAEEQTDTVEITEAYHYVVSERVDTFQAYEISVKAKNAVGDASVAPKRVTGYSGEDVPDVTPFDLSVVSDSITGNSASLQWVEIDPDPERVKGFFRGYRIQFWKKSDGPEMMRETDYIVNQPKQYPRPRTRREAGDLVQYRLTDLPPFAEILLQVRVLNKYYVGPPSDTIQFTTQEGVSGIRASPQLRSETQSMSMPIGQRRPRKPGPPAMFEVIARGSTHFELRWEEPEEPNGILSSYMMSYQQITGLNLGRLQYRQAIDDPSQLQARLTGLQPETDYRIYLSAATSSGKGEPIFLDARTTHAGPPSAPTFEVMDIGEDWAIVAWEPSRSGNPGSVFYVQYRARGEYNWVHSPDEVLAYTMKLNYLDPGTTYQARAVSKNGAGDQAPAEWQTFTTGGIGPGRVDLKTAFWFYSIFGCLLFLALFMIGFIFVKRCTDSWWEVKEAEIEEQVRQLQAEEAIRQLGIVNQYAVTGSHEMINSSYGDPTADYYRNKQPLDDEGSYDEDEDNAAGFGKGYQSQHSQEPYINQEPHLGYPEPQHVGYQPPQGGYQPPQGGYQPPQGGYQPPQAGYQPPQGGYQPPQAGYQPPQGGYQPPQGGYQHQAGHRGSPVEDTDAYVQDGQYHLAQGQGQKQPASFI